MRSLNEVLLERKVDAQYVTLTLLLWESRECRLVMANAGAVPPMICRDGEIQKVRVEGVPLGLLENREYDEVTFEAKTGDLILLYSDGIQDQVNEADEEYGRQRLASVLQRLYNEPPKTIVEEIMKDLDEFRGATPVFDDEPSIVSMVRSEGLADAHRDRHELRRQHSLLRRRALADIAAKAGTPCYVYSTPPFWQRAARTTPRSATCRTTYATR